MTVPIIKPLYVWGSYYKYYDSNKGDHHTNKNLPEGFNLEDTYTYNQLGTGFYKHLTSSFLLNSGVFYGTGRSDYYDTNTDIFTKNKFWRVKADYRKYGAVSIFTYEKPMFDLGFFFKGYHVNFNKVSDESKQFTENHRKPTNPFFLEHGLFARLKINYFRFSLIVKGLTPFKNDDVHHDLFESETVSARVSIQI